MKFNTVTINAVTDDFGNVEKYRAVLNRGEHEYHVTDIVEAKTFEDVLEYSKSHWSTAVLIINE